MRIGIRANAPGLRQTVRFGKQPLINLLVHLLEELRLTEIRVLPSF
jgi:hypothetical protein